MWSKKTPFLMAGVVAIVILIWGQFAWPKQLRPLTNRLLEYPGGSIPTLRHENHIYRVTQQPTMVPSTLLTRVRHVISPLLPQTPQIAKVWVWGEAKAERESKQATGYKAQIVANQAAAEKVYQDNLAAKNPTPATTAPAVTTPTATTPATSTGACTQSLAYCTQYGNEVGRYGYVYPDGTVAGQYIAPDGTPRDLAIAATQEAAQRNAQVVATQLSSLPEEGLLKITGTGDTTAAIQAYLDANAVIDPTTRASITANYLVVQKQKDYLNLTDQEIKNKYGDNTTRYDLISSLPQETKTALQNQRNNNLETITKIQQFLNPTTNISSLTLLPSGASQSPENYLRSLGVTDQAQITEYVTARKNNLINYYSDLELVNAYADPMNTKLDLASTVCKGNATCRDAYNTELGENSTARETTLNKITNTSLVDVAKTNYALQLISHTALVGNPTLNTYPTSAQNAINETNTKITKALAAQLYEKFQKGETITYVTFNSLAQAMGDKITDDPSQLATDYAKYEANKSAIDNFIESTKFYDLTPDDFNPIIAKAINDAKKTATIPGLSVNGKVIPWSQVDPIYRSQVRTQACAKDTSLSDICSRYSHSLKFGGDTMDALAAELDSRITDSAAQIYLDEIFKKLTAANLELSTAFSNVATIDNPLVDATLRAKAISSVTYTDPTGYVENTKLTDLQIKQANEYLDRQLVTETYKIGGGAAAAIGTSLIGIGAVSALCGPGIGACFLAGLAITGAASWGASQVPLYEMTAAQYEQQRMNISSNQLTGGIIQSLYSNQGAWGDEGAGRSITTRDNQFALYNAIQTKLGGTTLSSLMSDTTYGAQVGTQAYALNQSEVFQNRQEQWTWASLPISMATTTLFGGSGASAANQVLTGSWGKYVGSRLAIDATQQIAGSALNYAQARAQFDTTSGDTSLLSTDTQVAYHSCLMTKGSDQCQGALDAMNSETELNRSNAMAQAWVSDALLGTVQTAAGYIGVSKQYNSMMTQAETLNIDVSKAHTVGEVGKNVEAAYKRISDTLQISEADIKARDLNTQAILAEQARVIADPNIETPNELNAARGSLPRLLEFFSTDRSRLPEVAPQTSNNIVEQLGTLMRGTDKDNPDAGAKITIVKDPAENNAARFATSADATPEEVNLVNSLNNRLAKLEQQYSSNTNKFATRDIQTDATAKTLAAIQDIAEGKSKASSLFVDLAETQGVNPNVRTGGGKTTVIGALVEGVMIDDGVTVLRLAPTKNLQGNIEAVKQLGVDYYETDIYIAKVDKDNAGRVTKTYFTDLDGKEVPATAIYQRSGKKPPMIVADADAALFALNDVVRLERGLKVDITENTKAWYAIWKSSPHATIDEIGDLGGQWSVNLGDAQAVSKLKKSPAILNLNDGTELLSVYAKSASDPIIEQTRAGSFKPKRQNASDISLAPLAPDQQMGIIDRSLDFGLTDNNVTPALRTEFERIRNIADPDTKRAQYNGLKKRTPIELEQQFGEGSAHAVALSDGYHDAVYSRLTIEAGVPGNDYVPVKNTQGVYTVELASSKNVTGQQQSAAMLRLALQDVGTTRLNLDPITMVPLSDLTVSPRSVVVGFPELFAHTRQVIGIDASDRGVGAKIGLTPIYSSNDLHAPSSVDLAGNRTEVSTMLAAQVKQEFSDGNVALVIETNADKYGLNDATTAHTQAVFDNLEKGQELYLALVEGDGKYGLYKIEARERNNKNWQKIGASVDSAEQLYAHAMKTTAGNDNARILAIFENKVRGENFKPKDSLAPNIKRAIVIGSQDNSTAEVVYQAASRLRTNEGDAPPPYHFIALVENADALNQLRNPNIDLNTTILQTLTTNQDRVLGHANLVRSINQMNEIQVSRLIGELIKQNSSNKDLVTMLETMNQQIRESGAAFANSPAYESPDTSLYNNYTFTRDRIQNLLVMAKLAGMPDDQFNTLFAKFNLGDAPLTQDQFTQMLAHTFDYNPLTDYHRMVAINVDSLRNVPEQFMAGSPAAPVTTKTSSVTAQSAVTPPATNPLSATMLSLKKAIGYIQSGLTSLSLAPTLPSNRFTASRPIPLIQNQPITDLLDRDNVSISFRITGENYLVLLRVNGNYFIQHGDNEPVPATRQEVIDSLPPQLSVEAVAVDDQLQPDGAYQSPTSPTGASGVGVANPSDSLIATTAEVVGNLADSLTPTPLQPQSPAETETVDLTNVGLREQPENKNIDLNTLTRPVTGYPQSISNNLAVMVSDTAREQIRNLTSRLPTPLKSFNFRPKQPKTPTLTTPDPDTLITEEQIAQSPVTPIPMLNNQTIEKIFQTIMTYVTFTTDYGQTLTFEPQMSGKIMVTNTNGEITSEDNITLEAALALLPDLLPNLNTLILNAQGWIQGFKNLTSFLPNPSSIISSTRQTAIGFAAFLEVINPFTVIMDALPIGGAPIINMVEESSTSFARPTTINSLAEYIDNTPRGNESELEKETRLNGNLQQSLEQEPRINNGVEPVEFLNPQDLIVNSEIYRLKQIFADQTPYGKQLQRIFSKVRGSFFGVIGVKGGALYTRTQALVELHGKATGYTFFNQYDQVDQVQESTIIKDIDKATTAVQFATLLTLKYQHTGLYADANDGVRYDRPNTVGAAERSAEIFGRAVAQDREKVKELARPDRITPELFALYTDNDFWNVVFDLAQKEIKKTTYNEFKSTLDPPSPNSINEALNLTVTTLYPGHQTSANPRQNPALLYWFEQFWAQNSDNKLEPGFIANSLNNDITTFTRWYKLDEKRAKESTIKSSFISTILNPNQVGDVASRDQILSDLFVSLMGHKTGIQTATTFDTILADLPATYPDNTPNNAESFELSQRFIRYLRDKANIPEPLFTLLEKLIIDPTHAQKIYFAPLWEKFFVDYYDQLSVEEKEQNPITIPQDYREVFLKLNPHITPKDLEDAYNTGLLNSDAQPMISSFGINVAVKVLKHQVVLRLDAKGLSQANSVLSFQQIGGDILLRVVTDGVIKDIKIDTDKACPGCYLARGASVGDEYVLISPKPLNDDQLKNLQTILQNGKDDENYHGAKWLTVDSRTGQVKVEDAQIKQLDTKVAAEEVYGPDNALAPVPSPAQIRNLLERNYPNVIDIIKDLYSFGKNENPNIDQIMERVNNSSNYPTPYDRDLTLQLIVMTYTDYLVDQQLTKIVPTGNYPQIISTQNIETYQRMLYTLKPGQVLVFRRGIELYLGFPGNSGSINTLHIDVPGTFKQINDSEGYQEGDRLASHVVGIVLSQLESQKGVLTQDQLRTISDQIHNEIDNTSYTTSKGATYQLHSGTAVVHAKSPDRWVYNYMDSTRSQGNSDFIVHLQQDLKNGKNISTFISTYYSDPKRGLSRLLQLTHSSSLADAIYKLSDIDDLDLFLPALHKAILDYTPARQSRDLLSARLNEASQRGATNIYSNISTPLPGSETLHKLFYIFSDPNTIEYSLDDQATVLDALPAGARIHFRVGLVDEETDSEYVKLDNGTWQVVEKIGWQVRFPTLFELATQVLVFAPDLGSGQAFFQQLISNPDKIFIGFNAAARIKDGVLSEPAIYGLSVAYTLIQDLLFELQKHDPTITIKDLACRATVACNTISLFHERALALANLEEGSGMFTTALPLIKNLVNPNPDKYLVISTDGYQKEVIEKHDLPTYRSRIMGQSNPALFTKAMSIVQEIIWRQKALDKVFIPEEILNADPDSNNTKHIEYIANRYRLTTRVHDLIEELLKLEDQLGYPIRLILACTELPDAFKMAAKQDLYVKAYMERGGNLDTLDPQNFSPLDPALLVNAELVAQQYSDAFKTAVERLRALFPDDVTSTEQPTSTGINAYANIQGVLLFNDFATPLFHIFGLPDPDTFLNTLMLNARGWATGLKNLYIDIFGDNEKLNAFVNPRFWSTQLDTRPPTFSVSAPYPLLESDPNLPPLPPTLKDVPDHFIVFKHVTGHNVNPAAEAIGSFTINLTSKLVDSTTPLLTILSRLGKKASILGPSGQHRMTKHYQRPTTTPDTIAQAELALRAQITYFEQLFVNLKDNQLVVDTDNYDVKSSQKTDRNIRLYFPQENISGEVNWYFFDLPLSRLINLAQTDPSAIRNLALTLLGEAQPDLSITTSYSHLNPNLSPSTDSPLGSITFSIVGIDNKPADNEPYMLFDPNVESRLVTFFSSYQSTDINSPLYINMLRAYNSHTAHGIPVDVAMTAASKVLTNVGLLIDPTQLSSRLETDVRPLETTNSRPHNKIVEKQTNKTYKDGLPVKLKDLFKATGALLSARLKIREVVNQTRIDPSFQALWKKVRDEWKISHPDSPLSPVLPFTVGASLAFGEEGNAAPVNFIAAADTPNSINVALSGGTLNNNFARLANGYQTESNVSDLANKVNNELEKINELLLLETQSRQLNYSTISRILTSVNFLKNPILKISRLILGHISEATLSRVQLSPLGPGDNATDFETAAPSDMMSHGIGIKGDIINHKNVGDPYIWAEVAIDVFLANSNTNDTTHQAFSQALSSFTARLAKPNPKAIQIVKNLVTMTHDQALLYYRHLVATSFTDSRTQKDLEDATNYLNSTLATFVRSKNSPYYKSVHDSYVTSSQLLTLRFVADSYQTVLFSAQATLTNPDTVTINLISQLQHALDDVYAQMELLRPGSTPTSAPTPSKPNKEVKLTLDISPSEEAFIAQMETSPYLTSDPEHNHITFQPLSAYPDLTYSAANPEYISYNSARIPQLTHPLLPTLSGAQFDIAAESTLQYAYSHTNNFLGIPLTGSSIANANSIINAVLFGLWPPTGAKFPYLEHYAKGQSEFFKSGYAILVNPKNKRPLITVGDYATIVRPEDLILVVPNEAVKKAILDALRKAQYVNQSALTRQFLTTQIYTADELDQGLHLDAQEVQSYAR